MRKPLEREKGQYVHDLNGLEEYAKEVALKLCEKYPDVDIIDIEYMFQKKLSYQRTLQMALQMMDS